LRESKYNYFSYLIVCLSVCDERHVHYEE